MAILKTKLREGQDVVPGINGSANEGNGKLRLARVQYETTGLEADGDVLEIVRLKPGAVLVPALSFVSWEPLGSSVSGPLGTESNDQRMSQNFSISGISTGTIVADTTMGALDGWAPKPLTKGDDVVTFGPLMLGGPITPGKKLVFGIAYVDE